MSHYLNFYIKPKDSEKYYQFLNFSGSTNEYSFFREFPLSTYAYESFSEDSTSRYFKLDSSNIEHAKSDLNREIIEYEKIYQLKLSRYKNGKGDESEYEIVDYEKYINEKKDILSLLNILAYIVEETLYSYSSIEGIYTNYD